MPRSNLLTFVFLGLAVFAVVQLLLKHAGAAVTLGVLAAVAGLVLLGYLVHARHPLAARLHAHPVGRPLVRVVCRLGRLQPPDPPTADRRTDGGSTAQSAVAASLAAGALKGRVIGQDAAVDAATEAVRQACLLRARTDGGPAGRPLAVLLLVGGEGLGKRTLAEELGRRVSPAGGTLCLDLAGVADDGAALFGTAGQDGALTGPVRRQPAHTILFEHLEAAGPRLLARLHGLLATGRCPDPLGGEVSFADCLIALTWTTTDAVARLGPGFGAAIDRVCPFRAPDPFTIASVAARLMQAECGKFRMTLDYVDPQLVADEAAAFDPAHGYRLTEARVARTLSGPILRAVEHDHDRLVLLETDHAA